MEDIKERLVKIQEILNLSVAKMARECNINYRILYGYFTQSKNQNIDVLRQIANTYNISIIWLLTGKGDMYITKNQCKAMPKGFIIKLKKDLSDKDDNFYNHLVAMRGHINRVLSGEDILTQYEVIDLAKNLNQPIDKYVWLAGYKSNIYDKILSKNVVILLLNKLAKLPDSDMDNLLSIMDTVLKSYIDRKELSTSPLTKKQNNKLKGTNVAKEKEKEDELDYEIF